MTDGHASLRSRPSATDVHVLSAPRPRHLELAEDVRTGFARRPKVLPPKYFYDARGSELFERITRLPEYYPTRIETSILETHADRLLGDLQPDEVVELGSGSSRKTRLLLDAMHDGGGGVRYVPLDISEAAVAEAAAALRESRSWLDVHGHVGDFTRDLPRLPRAGRRLLAFLGSTIGNLLPPDRHELLRAVRQSLRDGDVFLLGADLVKSPDVLVPAYDDAAGVTAEFNRNILHVINRELDGDVSVSQFDHRAVWNDDAERIEMHLVAGGNVDAYLAAIDLHVHFDTGEPLVTEYSCKFRVAGLEEELSRAGLQVAEVLTDPDEMFAVLVARPQP